MSTTNTEMEYDDTAPNAGAATADDVGASASAASPYHPDHVRRIARPERHASDISVASILFALWDARRWLIIVPMCASILAAVTVLLLPSRYEARTSFTGEWGGGVSALGNLSGLASLAGVSGLSGAMGSADLFAALAKSQTVLRAVLDKEFTAPGISAKPHRLLDLLGVEAQTEAELEARGLKHLSDRLSVSSDMRTNIVSVTVTLGDPQLAAAVANAIVTEINRFNIERRRSQSGEQRRFAEERLHTAEAELSAAEQAYKDFLTVNRSLGSSPALRVEHDRLQRDVTMKQEIVSTIRRRFEEARIAEVQDIPVITVIDVALPPVRRAWPRRTLTVLATAFLTGCVTLALVILAPRWSPLITDLRSGLKSPA